MNAKDIVFRKDKIELENKVDRIEARLKLVEDAFEELVQTRVKHIDLAEDEEFTLPVGKRKKPTTRKKAAKVG